MLSDVRRRGAKPTPRIYAILLAVVVIGGTLAMRADLTTAKVRIPVVGQPAKNEVRAWRSVRIPNSVETEARRDEARRRVPAVYDFEPGLTQRRMRLLRDAYAGLSVEIAAINDKRKALQERIDQGGGDKEFGELAAINTERKRAQAAALQHLGIPEASVDFDGLDNLGYSRRVADVLGTIFSGVYQRPVVGDRSLESRRARHGLVLRQDGQMRGKKKLSVEALDDQKSVRLHLAEAVGSRLEALAQASGVDQVSARSRSAVVELLGQLIVPTASFAAAATRAERERAAAQVEQISVAVTRGQILVHEGETVSEGKVALLRAVNDSSTANIWLTALGSGLLIALLVLCVHIFALRHLPRYRPDARDLAFLVITLVGMLVVCALGARIVSSVAQQNSVSLSVIQPLVPVTAGALVVGFVLNGSATLVFMIISSPLLAYTLYGDLQPAVPIVVAGLVGAALVSGAHRRADVLRAGVAAGLAGWVCNLGFNLLNTGKFNVDLGYEGLSAVGGGLIAAMVVHTGTPILEWALKYMTNLRMAELATMEHPVLRELAMRAPGSHHHSMMVAALGEAGAIATGRNALLVKVMAYYHDIGKMNHAEYFAENQGKENPHDKVKPSISALIIRKHVTEGLEMARKHGFEEEILDGIASHHGTRVISYFYNKAVELAGEGERVEVADYTYAGPKPQNAEVAILMIADSIEAAARSLPDPNPDRLRGLVQKITNKIFSEGQLEECDLTLRDLHDLAQAFHKVLCGIYHHRPQYQESAAKERRESASSTKHKRESHTPTTTPVAPDHPEDEEDDREHLRRLGTG